MYCPKCGGTNEDTAANCAMCGAALPRIVSGLPRLVVPNHLVWAILATFCCCVPLGIPAIVYAAQVDPKLAGGDYDGAVGASNKANMWCWIAFGVGVVANIVCFMLGFLGAFLGNR